MIEAKGQPAVIVPTTTQTPKAIIPAETTISMMGRALFMHQRGNSPQIAAPQRATNQAIESQTSTSSRFTNQLARRANRKVSVLFLLSFIACSCFCIAPARRWRACRLALARV
jgi:hypothetical protein